MNDIKNYLDMYKDGLLNTTSIENELSKYLDIMTFSDIILEKSSSPVTNSTYVATIVPEYLNNDLKLTFVLDDLFVKNTLTSDETIRILEAFKNGSTQIAKDFNDKQKMLKDTEISASDCIQIYFDIYAETLKLIPTNILDKLQSVHAFDQSLFDNVQLALKTGNEKVSDIVEYCLSMKIVPEYLLQAAERLFKNNNVALANTCDFDAVNTPEINKHYAKLASVCNDNDTKPESTQLDPNYIAHI